MFLSVIAAGALVSSIVVAPSMDEPHRDKPQGSAVHAGWVTLYSLSYFRGSAVHIELPPSCSDLPHAVGSAVNNSTRFVSFYFDSSCGGVPVVVEPGGEVEEFSGLPRSFDSLPPVAASPGP